MSPAIAGAAETPSTRRREAHAILIMDSFHKRSCQPVEPLFDMQASLSACDEWRPLPLICLLRPVKRPAEAVGSGRWRWSSRCRQQHMKRLFDRAGADRGPAKRAELDPRMFGHAGAPGTDKMHEPFGFFGRAAAGACNAGDRNGEIGA